VLTQRIAKDPSWQAAAWLLERLYPKEYGRSKVIVYVDPERDKPRHSLPARITFKTTEIQGKHT